jgi:hypothetical protein
MILASKAVVWAGFTRCSHGGVLGQPLLGRRAIGGSARTEALVPVHRGGGETPRAVEVKVRVRERTCERQLCLDLERLEAVRVLVDDLDAGLERLDRLGRLAGRDERTADGALGLRTVGPIRSVQSTGA